MWRISTVLVLFGIFCVEQGQSLQCWSCSSDIDRECSDRFNQTLDYYRYRSGGGGGPYYQAQQGYSPNPPYNRDYNNRDYNNRDINNRDYNNRDYNNQGRNYDNQGRYDSQGNYNPQDRDRNYDSQRRNFDSQGAYYPSQGRAYDNRPHDQRPYDSNYPSNNFNRPLPQDFGGPRLITCDENEARLTRMRAVCLKKVQRLGYDSSVTVIRRCDKIPMEKEIGTCYDATGRGITLDFCEYCEYDGCNSAHSKKISMILVSLVPLAIFFLFNA